MSLGQTENFLVSPRKSCRTWSTNKRLIGMPVRSSVLVTAAQIHEKHFHACSFIRVCVCECVCMCVHLCIYVLKYYVNPDLILFLCVNYFTYSVCACKCM